MNATINTTNMKVYNFKTQSEAEREACRSTAEDWMYGESYQVENTTYQYYTEHNKNVMLEITVDTISVFQITQIDLRRGDARVYVVNEL